MRISFKKGFSFGITSGIITTLGLIIGLNSSTGSKLIILSGILAIAIADALSDALGIHISQESEKSNTHKQVWEATFSTFLAKLIIPLTFLIPILLLELKTAILVSVIWGLLILSVLNYFIAKERKINPRGIIFEHIAIAIVVIILTHLVGVLISHLF